MKAKGDNTDPAQRGISFAIEGAIASGAGELAGAAAAKVQGLELETDAVSP